MSASWPSDLFRKGTPTLISHHLSTFDASSHDRSLHMRLSALLVRFCPSTACGLG